MASAAAAHSQVLAITQAGEDLRLPEPVDLAFCRFLLLHVVDPAVVLRRMAAAVRPGRMGRGPGADHLGRADRRPALLDARRPPPRRRCRSSPPSAREAGLVIVDAWAEAPAGAGPGPVADYVEMLTEVDPGDDPVVLPPLVTVVAQVPDG